MEKPSIKYLDAMERLEVILRNLDESKIGVDDLASQVEEAAELIKVCKNILIQTESRVQESLQSLQSEMQNTGEVRS